MTKNNLIFNENDVRNKIKRLSLQILEDHYNQSEIHLIGIAPGGNILAAALKKSMQKIKPIEVHEHSIALNKKNPLDDLIDISVDAQNLKDKCVVIVDDVVNTGKTTFYALQPLVNVRLKSLKVAVLVDRLHKKFPVHCDYVGNTLSTTMKEHIDVKYSNNLIEGVYLI